jgi:metallo-beta-lactamase class B
VIRSWLVVVSACGAAPALEYTAAQCPHCTEWTEAQAPVRLFANTYWVGTHALGAILVTSPQGHVLVDGALPASAPAIAANVRALGFRVEDIKLILSSHTHYDHAGGIAALQRASGATVAASPASARELARGGAEPDDPQYAIALPFPAVHDIRTLHDGEVMRVGPLALTAHFTPGHTPGGTTWTWQACDGARCANVVYADSLTAVSSDDYRFTDHPDVLAGFAHSFEVLEALPCDVLVTPHPGASQLWDRVGANALVDGEACRRLAADAKRGLADRVAKEQAATLRHEPRPQSLTRSQ